MPHIVIKVVDAQSRLPLSNGVTVSVEQDKLFEGFKEQFRQTPDASGIVSFEGTSATKYRITAGGTSYKDNEQLVDTGFNLIQAFDLQDITVTLALEKKIIPLPGLDLSHYTRDIGLAQIMPIVIVIVAVAAAIIGIAYLASRAPKINLPKITGEK
jgi:hypothetical protein